MKLQNLVGLLVLPLLLALAAACGTPAAQPGLVDAEPTEDAEPASDLGPEEDAPTDVEIACEGPNPALSCLELGCEEHEVCLPEPDTCAIDSCECVAGDWVCQTRSDCGPRYACVDTRDETPENLCRMVGTPVDVCPIEGLECSWGEECCCGACHPSLVCSCNEGNWACMSPDMCFIANCFGRPCDTDADCQHGSVEGRCVEGICERLAPGEGWSLKPDLTVIRECEGEGTDAPYIVVSAALEDGLIVVEVEASGGNRVHAFRVCWNGYFSPTNPVQVSLQLQHRDGGDTGEEMLRFRRTVAFENVHQAFLDTWDDKDSYVINITEHSFTIPVVRD